METFVSVLALVGFAWTIYMFISDYLWDRRVAAAGTWESLSSERLLTWRMKNPGVYIGLSPHGTALVVDRINSHKNYLVVFNIKYDLDEFLEFLESLLNEFPDPSPHHASSKEPHKKRLFLFLCRKSAAPMAIIRSSKLG